MKRIILTTLLAGMTVTSANPATAKPTPKENPALETFGSCSEVRDMLADTYAQQLAHQFAYPQHNRYSRPSSAPMAEGSATRASTDSASSGPSTYTKTNVQEEGVDENDTVKTDGKHVYTVNGKDVVIVKSWPANEAHQLSRLTLGDHVTPQSLFLRGDKLVVFSHVYEPAEEQAAHPRGRHYYYAPPKFQGTRVSVVDVSDRAEPRIERQEDYEGWSQQARMIGSDVYFVFNTYLQAPQDVWNVDNYQGVKRPKKYLQGDDYHAHLEKVRKKLAPQVRKVLAKQSIRDLLPQRRVVRADGRVVSTHTAVACSDLQRPPVPSSSLLGIAHLDVEDSGDRGSTAMFGNGWQVYASDQNLYVTGTTWGWAWWGGQNPQNDWYKTQIHKFALRGDDGQPEYRASGKVDGWLLNQFSMSEWDGHFRIATTDWNVPGRNGGGNHLTVLKEQNGKLVQTGAVRGLAKGERIYSVRMTGDIAYMVTFRQTDPLYTIDLSDPSEPEVLGELKINGFSSYIHPLGPDHLLTVGQDATDEGRVLGLHLQIFDVSDLSNPRRVHHKRISEERWSSWSPAMWNHHAFTFDASRNLLVLPVVSYQPEAYTGAMVMKADPRKGFKEYGFLTQNNKTGKAWCKEAYGSANASQHGRHYGPVCQDNQLMWYTQIQRTIIMDDYVFALSNLGMTAHPLRRPDRVIGSTPLGQPQHSRELGLR